MCLYTLFLTDKEWPVVLILQVMTHTHHIIPCNVYNYNVFNGLQDHKPTLPHPLRMHRLRGVQEEAGGDFGQVLLLEEHSVISSVTAEVEDSE